MSRCRSHRLVVVVAFLCLAAPVAARAEPAASDTGSYDAAALLDRAAINLGGGRNVIEATLTVSGSRLGRSRKYRFRRYQDGARRRSFLSILEPAKRAGTHYLWVAPVAWIRVRGDDTTLRLTREDLAAPWLDGHFSLLDVLCGGPDAPSDQARVLRVEPPGEGEGGGVVVVIESTTGDTGKGPSRVVDWIEAERGVPLRREIFDEKGRVARVLRYRDVREVSGRFVPHVWEMAPAGERKRVSRVAIETIRLDADFDEAVFTTGNLTSDE